MLNLAWRMLKRDWGGAPEGGAGAPSRGDGDATPEARVGAPSGTDTEPKC
jgi:hypothetical protein